MMYGNELSLYGYYRSAYEQSPVVLVERLHGEQQKVVALGNSPVGIYITA